MEWVLGMESIRNRVFWMHASNAARFEAAYRNFVDRLEPPG